MKKYLFYLMAMAMVFCRFEIGLAHTSAETNRLVRTLVERAACFPFCDVPVRNDTIRVPNYSNPVVFFSQCPTLDTWPHAEKVAAFISYLNNEWWKIDFKAEPVVMTDSNDLPPNPSRTVFCCVNMNYTNVLPGIRRIFFNRSLDDHSRLSVLEGCLKLSPVDDETTEFVRSIFTNRLTCTSKDRDCAFGYANKVAAMVRSNLVSRLVGDRAAQMFVQCYSERLDWDLSSEYDGFLSEYFDGYAMSSNRLAFLDRQLLNTNLTQNADWHFVVERFQSITNQLHLADQPLQQLAIDEGGNE